MGPLMIDIQGTSLTNEDKELLAHPLVGGLILFTRNYEDKSQLTKLTTAMRLAAKSDLLIAVDHEGGRVQRFREGFSRIPAMAELLISNKHSIKDAKVSAFYVGQLMALEVQAVGIDISFAPVLDVNGISDVIGDRAFDSSPQNVTALAAAFIEGMSSVGMKATGKHFPGHGSVKEDSHIAIPVDNRSFEEINGYDLLPFKQLMPQLSAMMPAHIIFPNIDKESVGFSSHWLQVILREKLGFKGVIFSDDLSMKGASVVGGYVERAEAAQTAGCDMLLMCNDRAGAINVIDNANLAIKSESQQRIKHMLNIKQPARSTNMNTWQQMQASKDWQKAYLHIQGLL